MRIRLFLFLNIYYDKLDNNLTVRVLRGEILNMSNSKDTSLSPELTCKSYQYQLLTIKMNTVTHALLPIVAICAYQRLKPKTVPFKNWQLFFVGVLGAAPDLLNPHLSLQSRHQSWSHGVTAWLALTVLLTLLIYIIPKRVTIKASIMMSLAYLLHMLCDTVSGGIGWLQPFSDDIIGAFYVSPFFWIPMDIVLIFAIYLHFRIPLKAKAQADKEHLQS